MAEASFRFYGNLNDFLPAARRQQALVHLFDRPVSIKDAVESLGVPHPEIDLLAVCGVAVPFAYRLQPGDRVAVFPRFKQLDVGAVSLVRPPALGDIRFVLDAHLGRLAAYLRLAGLDSLYSNRCGDDRLAAISHDDRRVLLTRDVALLKRALVEYGYWVRETDPRRQMAEIVDRFDLAPHLQPFRRCLRCNTLIEPVPKSAVLDRLPPRTRQHYEEFYRCAGCGRVYWKGGHWERMRAMLETVASSE